MFSKEAVLPGLNDAEMGPANSLHASAYYREYNERFDLPATSVNLHILVIYDHKKIQYKFIY